MTHTCATARLMRTYRDPMTRKRQRIGDRMAARVSARRERKEGVQ